MARIKSHQSNECVALNCDLFIPLTRALASFMYYIKEVIVMWLKHVLWNQDGMTMQIERATNQKLIRKRYKLHEMLQIIP